MLRLSRAKSPHPGFEQYPVKNDCSFDVPPVRSRSPAGPACRCGQAPGAVQATGFYAQFFAKAFGPPRIVPADTGHDGAQILARFRPPINAVSGLRLSHGSGSQRRAPCTRNGLEIGFVAQAVGAIIHAGDNSKHSHHIGREMTFLSLTKLTGATSDASIVGGNVSFLMRAPSG